MMDIEAELQKVWAQLLELEEGVREIAVWAGCNIMEVRDSDGNFIMKDIVVAKAQVLPVLTAEIRRRENQIKFETSIGEVNKGVFTL